jgi:transcriptional regulator with XRE-family HTH domain
MEEKDNETLKREIGGRLATFRTIKHATQREMGDSLECSRGVYQSYESGRRALQYDMIMNLHDMGCNLNWFFSGTGNITRDESKNEKFIQDKAAKEAHKVEADLLYSSSKKPDKEAMIRAFDQVYGNLLLFYGDTEQRDRLETVERYNSALKPLRDLF